MSKDVLSIEKTVEEDEVTEYEGRWCRERERGDR
jgi:hypothetical protein